MLRDISWRRTIRMPEIKKEINDDLLQNINLEANKKSDK